jgi:tetratricopeptide (TPR) repeat protein
MSQLGAGDVLADRFELERVAGRGGMGVVYRALDRGDGSVVAVKVLERCDEAGAARFIREGALLARLAHPGIVRYVDHGVSSAGEPFLAMEWLDGEDLGARLERGPLRIDEAVTLAARVASALSAAHARHIVHRDVKPSNLFLVGGDVAATTLLDFGVARWRDGAATLTRTGAMIGTPAYMAPEQARAERQLDSRADVYALGCVLYECLGGHKAFEAEHLVALLAKVLFEEPAPLRGLQPEVPGRLAALVHRMLAKDRAARPADGAALCAELEALDGAEPAPEAADPLTGTDERLVSVVMLEAQAPADTSGSTMTVAPADALHALAAHGLRFEELPDGTVVAVLSATGVATDLVERAAAVALALRPHGCVALSTGRARMRGSMPVGPIIDRAAALLRAASHANEKAGPAVAIDESTADLLAARFDVRRDGATFFLSEPPMLLERPRTVLGRSTPLVGRERELRSIEEIAAECLEEAVPTAVLLTGDPGVGKSRLRYELCQRLAARHPDLATWTARAAPLASGSPLALIASLVRDAGGVREGEPIEEQRERLAACIAELVPASEHPRMLAFLAELLGVAGTEDQAELSVGRNDPQRLADELRRAFEDFAAAAAARAPLLVTIEDIHWADAASLRHVDAALRRDDGRRLLVIATARPELRDAHPSLWSRRRTHEVRLDPLARRAAEELVRHVLGAGSADPRVARVVDRAAGNPFFLEELVRAVAEGGDALLPGTVAAMVHARLDALPEASRRVLRAGSIFGETFWRGAVEPLVGTVDVLGELSRLCEQELLLRRPRSRFARDVEYAFRHALIREGAYAQLPDEDRARGHGHAARWLVVAGEGDPVVVAEHHERAGETEAAIAEYLKAARSMAKGRDLAQAAVCAESAIRCGARGDARASARGFQCDAHLWSGEFRAVLACAADALEHAAPGSKLAARALGSQVLAAHHVGEPVRLAAAADALVDTLAGLAADPTLFTPTTFACLALYTAGEFERARRFEDACERLGAVASPGVAATMRGCMTGYRALYRDARTDAALSAFVDAAESLAWFGARYLVLTLRIEHAFVQVLAGGSEAARATCAAVISELGDETAYVRRFAEMVMSAALWRAGEHDAAKGKCEALVRDAQATGQRTGETTVRFILAEIHLARGDLHAAVTEAAIAASVSTFPMYEAAALAALAAARLRQGHLTEALAAAEAALDLCEPVSKASFFEVAVRVRCAEVLHAAGRVDEARRCIRRARDRLQRLGDGIADPEQLRGLMSLPEHVRAIALAEAWGG